MRRGDRTRFHQLHPVKLAVDWGTAAIAGTLLWRHDWVTAVAIGVVPSIVTTAVFLSGRFDDALGKIRHRPGARSVAEGLSPGVNAVRFGGVAIAWVGCWLQRPWWIPAGTFVVALGWQLAGRRSSGGLEGDGTDDVVLLATSYRSVSDAENGPRVAQARRTFSLMCRVEVSIQSSPSRIWTLLTNAKGFPGWNSTVTSIDGEIRDGQRIRVHVPGTGRTFTPLISNVVPDAHMTWTGGFAPLFKGVRTFGLTPQSDGSTTFVMQERFSGLMLPIAGRAMPDLGPVFKRYAADLKREAERTDALR